MSIKIALLGFGTVASGVPFLLKENSEKIVQAAHSEIEIAKVLVKDDIVSVRPMIIRDEQLKARMRVYAQSIRSGSGKKNQIG